VGIEQIVDKELKIPASNFAAGNKPEGFDVTLKELENEDYYTVKISGTQSAVNAVNVDDVIGVVDMNILMGELDIEEWSEGDYKGTIIFNLPDNVTLGEDYKMTLVLEDSEKNNDKNNDKKSD
jgi:hypothetical protein